MPAGGKIAFFVIAMVLPGAAFATGSTTLPVSQTFTSGGMPDCNVASGDASGGDYSVSFCQGGQATTGSCKPADFSMSCKPAAAPCGIGLAGNQFTAYCSSAPLIRESGAGATPHVDSDPHVATAPPPVDLLAAAQAALEAKTKAMNEKAIAAIGERADNAGTGQGNLIQSAKAVGETGSNQAATVGALYCAQGANDQAGDRPDLASQNYGACKQYFDAAGAMKTGAGGYKEDSETLAGDMAKDTLAEFEKNFGISGGDYMGRMLGSNGLRDELADMTKGKLNGETVAKAFDEAAPQAGDKFAVDLGGRGATKKVVSSAMRAELKKALEKDKDNEPARKTASLSGPSKADAPRIKNLEPLNDAFAGVVKESARELTIFDVVSAKYHELSKRQDL